MASLRKKPNSKFWIACFTLPDGRRTQRSTKTTDRKLAQKLADRFEDATRTRMTEVQARRIVSDIHEMVVGKPMEFLCVRAYLTQWLKAKEGTVAPTTRASYHSVVKAFLDFLGPRADADIAYVSTADIASFRDDAAARLSITSANNILKRLKIPFQQAWRDSVIADNPAARVATLKPTPADSRRSKRRAFTPTS